MAEVNTELFDWWLQRTAVYGLAFVFTAGVLLGILWVAYIIVGLLKKWVPLWFEAQIESHLAVVNGMKDLSKTLKAVHEDAKSTRSGLAHAMRAVDHHYARNEGEPRVTPLVAVHIRNARREFERAAYRASPDAAEQRAIDTEQVDDANN